MLRSKATIPAVICLAVFGYLLQQAHRQAGMKGFFCELFAIAIVVFGVNRYRSKTKTATDLAAKPSVRKVSWKFFIIGSTIFLFLFPFSIFFHSVGLAPGIAFIFLFAYLWADLAKKINLHGFLAAVILIIFVWLWGEAGKPGLVVMPVDLPSGREDLEFTSEGLANALETELQSFGLKGSAGIYSDSESSKILASARTFPDSPWYRGAETRPSALEGLYASHLAMGTQVEGFALSSIYHVLRHVRGKQLLEAQVLVGADGTLTLALRRFNFPLDCVSDQLPEELLQEKATTREGREAVLDLWKHAIEPNKLRHEPGALGCSPSFLRKVLDWLDIADLPAGGEERIANVTIGKYLHGDAQLTAALQLGSLEAMERLSPERLALYYDNAGRYRSALFYYIKALPELLNEAAREFSVTEESTRQRLANALIRIGDLEGNSNGSIRDQSYALAERILPDDLQTKARIGYSKLLDAKKLDWCKECQNPTQRNILLDQSISYLESAIQASGDDAVRRYGTYRRDETLDWVKANLWYAKVQKDEATQQKDPNYLGKTIADAQSIIDHLSKEQPRDSRILITDYFVLVSSGKTDLCQQAKELELLSDPKGYTLHNTLLIEDELFRIYTRCQDNQRARKHRASFDSLLALSRLESGYIPANRGMQTQPDEKTLSQSEQPLKDLLEIASEELAEKLKEKSGEKSTEQLIKEQEEPLKETWLANIGLVFLEFALSPGRDKDAPVVTAGQSNLCLVPESFGELAQRGRSLCAKVKAMACRASDADLKLAETASVKVPDDPYLRSNLGIVHLKMGKLKEALQDFREAARLNPRDPQLRNLLAYVSLTSSDDVDEGTAERRYGRMLDPQVWPGIDRFFQDHSLAPCSLTGLQKPTTADSTVVNSVRHH